MTAQQPPDEGVAATSDTATEVHDPPRRLRTRLWSLGLAAAASAIALLAPSYVVRAINPISMASPSAHAASRLVTSAVLAQTASSDAEVIPLYANFAKYGQVKFRPSLGEWSWIDPVDATVLAYQWGQSGDIPVVGDFNGNAATHDLAVWRPSDGTWRIWYDGGRGIQVTRQWGAPGDIPVVGDFNGNSRADLTVWRPSEGRWYIWYDGAAPSQVGCQPLVSNSGCQTSLQWGVPGDIPLAGNFAGQNGTTDQGFGPDDLTIFRPSTGTWWIWYDGGTGTQLARGWGVPGDIPLTGDYGGYPLYGSDLVIYRPGDSSWWVWHGGGSTSPGPAEARTWGQPGDIPMRTGSDCNSGSATCLAVYRPSEEAWYVAASGQNVLMPPPGYIFCANENSTCTSFFSGSKSIAYGANGYFTYRTLPGGTIACNNATFGDPAPGTAKACYLPRP